MAVDGGEGNGARGSVRGREGRGEDGEAVGREPAGGTDCAERDGDEDLPERRDGRSRTGRRH